MEKQIMNKGMSKRVSIKDDPLINVFELSTKTIVFTGKTEDVGFFLGCSGRAVLSYVKSKSRFKKTYALRYAKKVNS